MDYKHSYKGKTLTTNLISDFFGNISLAKSENNYRDIILHVSHNGETARFGEYYAYTYEPDEYKYISEHAFCLRTEAFTDQDKRFFLKELS